MRVCVGATPGNKIHRYINCFMKGKWMLHSFLEGGTKYSREERQRQSVCVCNKRLKSVLVVHFSFPTP